MKVMKPFPVLIAMVLLMAGSSVYAKRLPPKEVEPVIYKGVKYVAPNFKIVREDVRRGYVEARDLKSNKLLWEMQVYKTTYEPDLEQDAQDVFITSLTIKDGRLVVVNERSEIYEIDLQTKQISKIK